MDPSPALDAKACCQARNREGSPCTATPMTGESWCFFHHPDHQAEARAARLQGARTGRRVRVPFDTMIDIRSPQKVLEAASLVSTAVLRGEVDPKVGNCLAVLFSTALRASDQDVQRRLREIEDLLDDLKRQRLE